MSRRVPGAYGFTTAPRKMSFARIAREAKTGSKFILAHIKNTETEKEFLGVLIRKDLLPVKAAGLTLLGKPLTKITGKSVGGFRYILAYGKGLTAHKLANKVKQDLRTLQNRAEKRIVRVLVEAL